MRSMQAKVRGSLLGVAVGDALGAALEFLTKEEISQKYGLYTELTGGGYWDCKPGEVTDDTAMTIAVAKGILAEPEDPVEKIAGFFVEWAKTCPKDIGNTCRLVLDQVIKKGTISEKQWLEIAQEAHFLSGKRSAGNGSLMRTVPVALAYAYKRKFMLSLARRVSALTHYDMIAEECTAYYCHLISRLIQGADLKDVLKEDRRQAPWELDLSMPLNKVKTSGFVIHTLEAALVCSYQTSTFEEALITAVNLGGDTDTIGAVTGGLAGAYYGYEAIPERWLNKLHVKDELISLADQLAALDSQI